MADSMKTLLSALDKRRDRLGFSLRDLAERMGTSGYGHLGLVLKGKKNPTADYVVRIETAIVEIEKNRGIQ